MSPPELHVIAGPNGAGKSTLYDGVVRRRTRAEFVNADLLAWERFGHPAVTEEESRYGQDAAEERRAELIARRESLVVESTFSHPSKLDLLREARAAGYAISVYHVGVRTPEHAVGRVAARVAAGGHPVPEARIRGRYERNGPLIREAVLTADLGLVFDNSRVGRSPLLLATFVRGRGRRVVPRLPAWAETLYAADLA